jgi:hypothetical protein
MSKMIEVALRDMLLVLEENPEIAARFVAVLAGSPMPDGEWLPIAEAPLAKKTIRRLVRTGAIRGRLVAGRWYIERADLARYMRDVQPSASNDVDDDEALRAELGLRRAE